ncbi:MAG TPA: DMT family transporter [Clostridia bacterium]|nr:DMT family transporter [Clostridia bacterium]
MKFKDSYHPYAMVTILFWSLAYVLTRLTLRYFTPFSLGFLRYFVASLALAVVAVATKMKPPRKADIPWFLLAGAVGFFLYMIAFNKGQQTVTASAASVVIATVPVITALLARLIYKEKLRGYQWAAVAVEFAGVVVLTLMNGVFSVNRGLLWMLLAALALSAYNLLQRKLTKTYTALQTSTFGIFSGTLLLAVFLPASVEEAARAPGIQLAYVAVLGIFSGAIAYVAWSKAFAKANKTSQVSNYMFVTPLLTSVLGFVIAGEVPDPSTLLGGAMILLGVLLFNFGGKIRESLRRPEAGDKGQAL